MRKSIIRIKYLLFLAFLLLVAACKNEAILSEKPDESLADKVQIEIFSRANSYQLPSTKGLDDESTVGMTPWVLVFEGNNAASAKFVEAVQAFELASKRYVLLTAQPSGTKYQLLILANPPRQDVLHNYTGDITGTSAL